MIYLYSFQRFFFFIFYLFFIFFFFFNFFFFFFSPKFSFQNGKFWRCVLLRGGFLAWGGLLAWCSLGFGVSWVMRRGVLLGLLVWWSLVLSWRGGLLAWCSIGVWFYWRLLVLSWCGSFLFKNPYIYIIVYSIVVYNII